MKTTAWSMLAVSMMVGTGASAAHSQEPSMQSPLEEVTAAAEENRLRLDFDGRTFAGPAMEELLHRARRARFFLIGEEHGIAENPKLVAQLFRELVGDGYGRLAIEVSPPMAAIMDTAASRGGLDGLRELFEQPGGEPAFFGMAEEAELLVAVREAVPAAEAALWGVDYEVAGDRPLLRQLMAEPKPEAAKRALRVLTRASATSWAEYARTRAPQHIFSFAGDPDLVRELKAAWPNRNEATSWVLDVLEETLEINRLWVEGRGWESNNRRAALLRANAVRHLQTAANSGSAPKVLVKLGASHAVRGRNPSGTFDLGTLLPEIAAAQGEHALSLLVLPGRGSPTAVLDPSTWTYEPGPAKDGYARGLEAITAAAHPDAFTLIDLVQLRPIVRSDAEKYGESMLSIVHGFDLLLVMSGSTPSSELQHD